MEWHSINELREVDRDYSNLWYRGEYLDEYEKTHENDPVDRSIKEDEELEIKLSEDGEVLYRFVGNEHTEQYGPVEFKTKYGTYVSNDRGEFGCELISPKGRVADIHCPCVFELDDKIYIISSFCHFECRYLAIYEIRDPVSEETTEICDCCLPKEMKKEYPEAFHLEEKFCFSSIDLHDDCAYILAEGYVAVRDQDYNEKLYEENRLIAVKSDSVEVIRIPNAILRRKNKIIVKEDTLYVPARRNIAKVDLKTKEVRFFSVITPKDEMELLSVEDELRRDGLLD